ncbi:MAG: TolC family protein [Gemmatimonadetes bacterium]|nr:TolC family protein [Gemmatimonadota bacterium]
MMMKMTTLCLGAMLVLGETLAAQIGPPPPEPMASISLEEAIRIALRRSPTLAQADQAVGNAEESQRTARGAFLPSLSMSSGASLRSIQRFDSNTDRIVTGSSDSYNAGLSASMDVFQGGARFDEIARSRADIVAAQARRETQRFNVTLQTKIFFFQALEQQDLLEVATRRIDQAEQSLDLTRRRALAGEATRSDTLRARLELINARQNVLTSEVRTRAARFALGRHVGMSEPVAPEIPDDLDPRPLRLSEEEILASAEDQAPTVIAAEEGARASMAGLKAAQSAFLPTVRIRGGYTWANQGASFSGGDLSWNTNVTLSYSIFNRFTRGASIARAEYSDRVARFQAEDARLAARQNADGALRAVTTAERAIAIAHEAVAVSDEDLRVVRERYRLGVAIILDVITSQISSDQARVDLVRARYDYLVARAELESILGREL